MGHERYHEAVDYLERRLWHELPILPLERAMQGRIRTLLTHFGEPHRAMPVVHVGGSAGKGSTATMIAAMLRASGRRAALYTSPHLQTFIERISIDDLLIDPARFADLVLGLDPVVRKMHIDVLDGVGYGRPSLVEAAFAVAMKHFADQRVDAAVIEVGLGGRTDCTNIFDAPAVTVITNVELEHRERLGGTIGAIAREKAGIIRPTEGRRGERGEQGKRREEEGGRGASVVITGARRREALAVIEERCTSAGRELWRLGREIRCGVVSSDANGSVIDVRTPRGAMRGLRLPLAGAHQAANAALAVAAAIAYGDATGCALEDRALADGLASVRISGRMETVQTAPRVILDSAHNPVEARALAAALRTHFLRDGVRLHLVIGILGDKEQGPMVRAFASVADSVVVTQPPLGERAGDPARMIAGFRAALGASGVTFEPQPERALDVALAHAASGDIICIAGSMFLIGALRNRWAAEEEVLRRRSAALPGGRFDAAEDG